MNTDNLVLDATKHSEMERIKMCACTYCGSTSSITRDHIIPVSWTSPWRTYSRGDVVLACQDCNNLLQDKILLTVPERAAFLAQRLSKKHADVLRTPNWEDWELDELDYALRRKVESSMYMRDFVAARIAHCYHIATTSPLNYDVNQYLVNDKMAYEVIDYANELKLKSLVTIVRATSKATRLSMGVVDDILRERSHEHVAVTWKYERAIRLARTIANIITRK